MSAVNRKPQHVACDTCEHVWVVAYLPMDTSVFTAILKGARCPSCGSGSDKMRLRDANDVPPEAMSVSPELRNWLSRGERGISSNAIVEHLTPVPTGASSPFGDHPSDGDDLRRCMLLLDAVPALQPLMSKMATRSKVWAALVSDWDGLIAILRRELRREPGTCGRTYERMRQLLHPVDGQSLYETDGDWDAYERAKAQYAKRRRRRSA